MGTACRHGDSLIETITPPDSLPRGYHLSQASLVGEVPLECTSDPSNRVVKVYGRVQKIHDRLLNQSMRRHTSSEPPPLFQMGRTMNDHAFQRPDTSLTRDREVDHRALFIGQEEQFSSCLVAELRTCSRVQHHGPEKSISTDVPGEGRVHTWTDNLPPTASDLRHYCTAGHAGTDGLSSADHARLTARQLQQKRRNIITHDTQHDDVHRQSTPAAGSNHDKWDRL